MNENPIAIVLGGIFPHCEVIIKLKNRGYFTILIDYFQNPPAASFSDIHLKESAMDFDVVLKIAQEYNASLIVSPCLDQQMLIAVKVAEKLGLPYPFSSETVLKVTNKKYMKKLMLDNDIPTSRFYTVNATAKLDDIKLDYPIIVKPTDSCGAAGVRKIESAEELQDAVINACTWSRTKEVIIEEYKQGMEISVYSFICNGKASLITTQNRISVMGESLVKCYAAFNPAKISYEVCKKAEQIATDIAAVFKLDNVPLFYQAVVNNDDISVIEFSPRLGGGVSYRLMEKNAGYDMLEASIDSWLGNNNMQVPKKEIAKYLTYQIQGKEGVLDHVGGYKELIEQGIIDEIFFHKTKNMHISTEKASSSRVAAVLIKGYNEKECFHKLIQVVNSVSVIDINGNDITDRTNIPTLKDII